MEEEPCWTCGHPQELHGPSGCEGLVEVLHDTADGELISWDEPCMCDEYNPFSEEDDDHDREEAE